MKPKQQVKLGDDDAQKELCELTERRHTISSLVSQQEKDTKNLIKAFGFDASSVGDSDFQKTVSNAPFIQKS